MKITLVSLVFLFFAVSNSSAKEIQLQHPTEENLLFEVCDDTYTYPGVRERCKQKVGRSDYSPEGAKMIIACNGAYFFGQHSIKCLSMGFQHNLGLEAEEVTLCNQYFHMSDAVHNCITLVNDENLGPEDIDRCSRKHWDDDIYQCLRKRLRRNRQRN